MREYASRLSEWHRDGVLSHPRPAEVAYLVLREDSETRLVERFRHWRFEERQIRALVALRAPARRLGLAEFEKLLAGAIARAPGDYPAVLRPRLPSPELSAARGRQYADLLRGKRVALVGPEDSVVGAKRGR